MPGMIATPARICTQRVMGRGRLDRDTGGADADADTNVVEHIAGKSGACCKRRNRHCHCH